MADEFLKQQYDVVTKGTDNHMSQIDLRPKKIDGARAEWLMQNVNISLNKNMIPGDKSALIPNGIRVGSPCMTARGFEEKDFRQAVRYMDEAIKLSVELRDKIRPKLKKFSDFKVALKDFKENDPRINQLKNEVADFCRPFPFPYPEE